MSRNQTPSSTLGMNGGGGGGGATPHKPLANMAFNQHGGRRGTISASSMGEKMLRKSGHGSVRPGPKGMGMVNPSKPTQIHSGHDGGEYSHFHMLHEKYNER